MRNVWIRWFPVWICLLFGTGIASAADEDYRLGPGDLIKVAVYGYDELTTEVRISQTGFINYPLLGEVSVTGISPREAASRIAQKLMAGGFIREPKVDVLVQEYQSQKISVMGQVTKPGKYALTSASTVLDMLAEAGGLVANLSGDQATLLRKNGSKVEVDLHKLFEGDLTQNYTVAGGDTIFVPKAPQFYVYGEVQRPGMYRLERNMTVAQAITAGGGLTPRGTERRAVVRRAQQDGTQQEVKVETTSPLQPDDVLFIKESWF